MMFCNHFGVISLRLGTIFFGLFHECWPFHVCATLGHLSLPFALKRISVYHIHQTICFISGLPKMSKIGQLFHFVWLKCVSCKQKTFLRDAGTLCLSKTSFVHEKLICRELANSWSADQVGKCFTSHEVGTTIEVLC